ncbi:MAG: response regulator, partial [Planctomycetales bacterium]|nr:response regulator [Planctomycetales bacterium]
MVARVIRVLVVDDSRIVRESICDLIHDADDMEVAGQAASGEEALALAKHENIDLVTLDVQMPGMDGLQTLQALLAVRPIPVVMVSSVTSKDADATLAALEIGAVDYVAKADGMSKTRDAFAEELMRKIRMMAGSDVKRILAVRRRKRQGLVAPLP